MNVNVSNTHRIKIIAVIILLIIAFVGVSFLLSRYISTYILNALLAIIALTVAIALPIRQKHFSYYSIFLVVISSLFLMSGAIDNAYEIIVRPLPVLSQMEFSKFMQPTQVSRGLSSMGFGISYFIISSGLLFSKKLREKSKEKRLKFLLLIMCSVAVLYTASGINSIIEV